MYLQVGQSVELNEPADTTRFHASCPPGLSDDELGAVLERNNTGELVPGETQHIMVRVDAVRRLAHGRVDQSWDDDFAKMLAYADRKGWLSSDGDSIRAHLVRDDPNQ